MLASLFTLSYYVPRCTVQAQISIAVIVLLLIAVHMLVNRGVANVMALFESKKIWTGPASAPPRFAREGPIAAQRERERLIQPLRGSDIRRGHRRILRWQSSPSIHPQPLDCIAPDANTQACDFDIQYESM